MASLKTKSTGGSTSYYMLPEGAKQLQDLIEFHNMNAQRKEVFKAAWRVGSKDGNNDIYDWNKIVFFGLRELGRLHGRKDYLTMADEIIGDQSEDTTPPTGSLEDDIDLADYLRAIAKDLDNQPHCESDHPGQLFFSLVAD